MARRTVLLCLLPVAVAAALCVALPAAQGSATPVRSAAAPVSAARPSARQAAAGTGVDPAARVRTAGRSLTPRLRGTTTTTIPGRVLDPRAAGLIAAPSGNVSVTVTGDSAVVTTRVRALGGQVLARSGSASSVLLAKTKLTALAATSGITAVRAPIAPHELASPNISEGVSASGATAWHNAGDTGDGIAIGIVDAGFTGLAAAKTAGDLPSSTVVVNEDCANGKTKTTETSEHGTAVAEIVHQQAPGAVLHLYCVASNVGFAKASTDLQAYNRSTANTTKVKIVSSSLGFSDDGRGDGTGQSSGNGISTAYAVAQARRSGILWIQSAGNDAENHWSGKLADADKDGLVDIDGVFNENEEQYEDDISFVAGGTTTAPAEADIELQWDRWPATNSAITLQTVGYQCTNDYTATDGSACGEYPIVADSAGHVTRVAEPTPTTVKHVAGGAPYAEIDTLNTSKFEQYWVVYVAIGATKYPTTRYDLTYHGDVDGPSLLACATFDDSGRCTSISPRSYQSSISAPASSPYALAVGAADVGADGTAPDTLEPFSSQGPSIDGRVKPEITGWDGVSSPVYGVPSATSDGGFYGTSAAAPHVAGAAALVLAANPSFDAAQLQNFLEQRASTGSGAALAAVALDPPNNHVGHGLLTLGATPTATPVVPPAGSRYTAQGSTRILDTRTATGGHQGAVEAGQTVSVPVDVPDDATAVAVNVTGTNATASTYLTAYPGDADAPSTSNVNLSPTRPTAAAFAVVAVGDDRTITVRNASGSVDVVVDQLGYFATGAGTGGLLTSLAQPARVLDTRSSGPVTTLKPVIVDPGVPAGSSAVVVNITGTETTGTGFLNADATCSRTSSTVNLSLGVTRANLAIVQLASDGTFCITDVQHRTQVVVDVLGYLGTKGSQYHPLPSTTRVVDTRTGNGGSAGGAPSRALAAATSTSFYGSGIGDVPASATALMTGLVEATATATGYLVLYPGTTVPAKLTSNLNFTAGVTVANAAIVGLPASGAAAHRFSVYNRAGSTHAVVDVFGYFAPVTG